MTVPSFEFLAEPLFWIATFTAFVASIVRGFAGFGAGLIFMPVAAACLGPKNAAGILYIVDGILVLPFVFGSARIVDWREIAPLAIGAIVTVPLGVAVLLYIDPVLLRWGLSFITLASVTALAAGWRYHGPTRAWLSVLVGAVSGFMSGSVQIPGPPVLVYWLGRQIVSATLRANAFIFFMFAAVISGIGFYIGGIFTPEVLAQSAVMFPIYGIGIAMGARMFGLASEVTFRRIAYATIFLAAIASMPVW